MKYKGQIVFEKLSTPYFERVPKEYKENEACFIFINQGEMSLRSQTAYFKLKSGDGLLAKCLNYFFETNETQRTSSEGIEVVGVLLHPPIIEELFDLDLSQSNLTNNYNLKQVQVDKLLTNFKDSIEVLLDNPELADEQMIKTKLKEFLLLISKTQNESNLDFLASLFKMNETEFTTTVKNNLYSTLSNEEFAYLCGMSVSTFKRKFAETFDESPRKYFERMKMKKAAGLLKSANARISEIAYDCGYETISTFNRTFKTHFSTSPTEYRLSQTA